MVSYSLPRLFRSRVATSVVFVLLGVLQGTLAARMPAIKDGADLSNGTLGLALLGMPLGSLAAIQVTGRLIARWGSSPVTFAGLLVLCVATAGPSFATGFATLLPALILFGIGLGLTDTAMNAQAVTVERGYGRPIMSSFHGYASLGALAGAVGGAVGAHLGVSIQVYFPAVAAVAVVVGIIVHHWLLPPEADAHPVDDRYAGSHRTPWTRTLVLLATIAFLAMLAELAVADWSAVYLRDSLGSSASVAAFGYACFSLTMVVTRFLADRITASLGYDSMLRWGGLAAGTALAIGLATNTVIGAVMGWSIVGIGMAAIVPIVFTLTGNLPGVPTGAALSKVVGIGYLGSMIGPPLIGLTAEATTLKDSPVPRGCRIPHHRDHRPPSSSHQNRPPPAPSLTAPVTRSGPDPAPSRYWRSWPPAPHSLVTYSSITGADSGPCGSRAEMAAKGCRLSGGM